MNKPLKTPKTNAKKQESALKQEGALERLFEKISLKITPTQQEKIAEGKVAQQLIAALQKKLLPFRTKVILVGSSARDTGLAGDRDIDLFCVFPKTASREHAVEKTFQAAKSISGLKWLTRYAEHPYLQTQVNGFKAEVIPCFETTPNSPLKSAVDRTPLHMDYLQNALSLKQKRDVRVLKQFLRNIGIYGAELEVEGFSGLVCEHLILNYRSLQGLLENAAKWKAPVVIFFQEEFEGQEAALIKKFPENALILIDAVDKNRNAAAAASATNISKFSAASRAFLRAPMEKFFFAKPRVFSKKQLQKALSLRSTHFFAITAPKPDLVADILHPQMKKSANAIAKQLSLEGFRVFGHDFFSDEKTMFFIFELEESELPKIRTVRGPGVFDEKSFDAFVKQAAFKEKTIVRGPYISGDRVYADKKRRETKAAKFLQSILSKPSKTGVASHVAAAFKKAKMLQGKSALSAFSSVQAQQKLGNYLCKKELWL